MEGTTEQLIAKKRTNSDLMKRGIILCAGIVICVILIAISLSLPFYYMTIAALLIVAVGYGTYYLIQNTNIEYEYIVFEGELEITKIIAQRKRVPLICIDAKQVTKFGLLREAEESEPEVSLVLAYDGDRETACFADAVHPEIGKVRVLFSPDERVVEAFRSHFPRNLRMLS